MIRPVGGVMMVLGQGWGCVCLVGMLVQTSPAVQQVNGSSQNVPVSNVTLSNDHIRFTSNLGTLFYVE
jgi:hypothetical protein